MRREKGRLRPSRGALLAAVACVTFAVPAWAATPASASRALRSTEAVRRERIPGGVLEGPCGVAVSPSGQIYTSAYYSQAVDVFTASGIFQSQIGAGTAPEGPCQLAIDADGRLYANLWHEGVSRLLPSPQSFDRSESTGVAVDDAADVYVDDRTYVAVYEPSGSPVLAAGEPLRIGEGSLGDAYGLAAFAGRVYVADAADGRIKVFEPATEADQPVEEIDGSETPQHRFVSLVDAALAVDPTNGHLLVVDDLQPGYTHPEAAIYEFSAAGDLLGRLPGTLIDGGPSGLAVSEAGVLFATSGNSEEGAVFTYGPYTEAAPLAPLGSPSGSGSGSGPSAQGATAPSPRGAGASSKTGGPVASASETIQRGRFRVGITASLAPKRLPRNGTAPVRFSLATRITPTKETVPPQLQRIEIEINRHGKIDPGALPACQVGQIQPATSQAALRACRGSLVGQGSFSAKVLISQQAPFPSSGKVYAFNGTWKGKPAILAHVYGTEPVPTSNTIPFVIGPAHGTYGTKLSASLPRVTSKWGYVTGISMTLGRSFTAHGRRRSYLQAGCPAPKGFPGAVFALSRARLAFEGGKEVSTVLSRSCRAAG